MLSTTKTARLLWAAIISVLATGIALLTSTLPFFSRNNTTFLHMRVITLVQTVIACCCAAAQLFFLWMMIRYCKESQPPKKKEENWTKDLKGLDDNIARLLAKKD